MFLSTASVARDERKRLFVVSSYDRNYLWSQSTAKGLSAAMLHYGYLDNEQQAEQFERTDFVETSRAVIRKAWMNSKRRNTMRQIAEATLRITGEIEVFKPDLVMLGDDNAANYIGNHLLDTSTPVIFWGINGLPLKYGLVDSMDRPGHNVTGVWQAGYHKESLQFLNQLIPEAKTFAILACDSVTSRSGVKQIRALARRGELPLSLAGTVVTNSFEEFKERTLALSREVDAFYVLNHDTMHDAEGRHVDMLEVGRWYLENIRKPEVSHEDQFVREGMLAAASDSGFNQSYLAFQMAYDVLEQGLNPAHLRTRTPPRGALMVNAQRARMLSLDFSDQADLIEVFVPDARALQR